MMQATKRIIPITMYPTSAEEKVALYAPTFTAVVGTAILSSFNTIAGENCDWEELIIYNGIKRQATFCVELATTYSERQQGLMFREDLEFNEGMILSMIIQNRYRFG